MAEKLTYDSMYQIRQNLLGQVQDALGAQLDVESVASMYADYYSVAQDTPCTDAERLCIYERILDNMSRLGKGPVALEFRAGGMGSGSFEDRDPTDVLLGARLIDGQDDASLGVGYVDYGRVADLQLTVQSSQDPNRASIFNISRNIYVTDPLNIKKLVDQEITNQKVTEYRSLYGIKRLGEVIAVLRQSQEELYVPVIEAYAALLIDYIAYLRTKKLAGDIQQLLGVIDTACSPEDVTKIHALLAGTKTTEIPGS